MSEEDFKQETGSVVNEKPDSQEPVIVEEGAPEKKNKNVLLIISFILAALILGLLVYLVVGRGDSTNNVNQASESDSNTVTSKDVKLVMGQGASSLEDSSAAAEEAVSEMLAQMEQKKPNFVIVYSETSYDNNIISAKINELLGEVKIYGWTSFKGSMNNSGFDKLSILGFDSEKLVAGVGGVKLSEFGYTGEDDTQEQIFKAARDSAKEAVLRAVADSGKNVEEKPTFVLVSGSTYFLPGTLTNPIEERFIEGIESVVGKDVRIVGGLAADTVMGNEEKVFVNNQVLDYGSVSVAVIYSDLKAGVSKVGYAFLGGFTPTTKQAKVTRADGHLLYELDGRPCTEVYDEWTDGIFGDRIDGQDWVIDVSILYPLSNKISESDEVPGYYNKLVHYFNNPEPGVCKMATEVKEGEILHMLEGTSNMFVNRGAMTARLARADAGLASEEIAGGFMVFCAGSFLAIPEEDYSRVYNSIDEVMSGAPFIGGYEFGGFGSFAGTDTNRFSTQMCSFLVLGKN